MSITLHQIGLYALGMALLWAVPGPVWVALMARALAGGLAAAVPLAVGVAIGDAIWPLAAIFGLTWILSVWGDFLIVLRWVAAGVFVGMGLMLLRKPAAAIRADGRLTRPGLWVGFLTGLAVVVGNPKAILFYMGVLPGFFDITTLTGTDIAIILALSGLIPFLGNLALATFFDRARRVVSSPARLRRMNVGAGILLMGVGVAIAVTAKSCVAHVTIPPRLPIK